MKTTIELDEAKLIRIMKYTGLKTRKEAINYALTHAERIARLESLLATPFYVTDKQEIVDPNYDLMALREREKPKSV